jgi:hypothetical protein
MYSNILVWCISDSFSNGDIVICHEDDNEMIICVFFLYMMHNSTFSSMRVKLGFLTIFFLKSYTVDPPTISSLLSSYDKYSRILLMQISLTHIVTLLC